MDDGTIHVDGTVVGSIVGGDIASVLADELSVALHGEQDVVGFGLDVELFGVRAGCLRITDEEADVVTFREAEGADALDIVAIGLRLGVDDHVDGAVTVGDVEAVAVEVAVVFVDAGVDDVFDGRDGLFSPVVAGIIDHEGGHDVDVGTIATGEDGNNFFHLVTDRAFVRNARGASEDHSDSDFGQPVEKDAGVHGSCDDGGVLDFLFVRQLDELIDVGPAGRSVLGGELRGLDGGSERDGLGFFFRCRIRLFSGLRGILFVGVGKAVGEVLSRSGGCEHRDACGFSNTFILSGCRRFDFVFSHGDFSLFLMEAIHLGLGIP